MFWAKREAPTGRVWALVLWDHSYLPIPAVMQFEPKSSMWIDDEHEWPNSQVQWCPLPYHERFGDRTHAMPEPGETIVNTHCPCCGAYLDVEYGSDENEIVVYGEKKVTTRLGEHDD